MTDIAIVVVLALVVGCILRSMIRDIKAGKSSCGCDCGNCGLCKTTAPHDPQ